ncbi:MAG: hypothetical protein AB7K86_06325 [Rhodospirillales bacterium]
MMKFTAMVVVVAVVALLGGLVFLSMWDIPPPSKQVEKVIPNDRFQR